LLAFFYNINAKQYLITDYNVSNDSTILNTRNIQQVIDIAAKNGGGTIVVPEGTFLSGALFFREGTSLFLKEGAVLKGSDNIADYPLLPSRMEGKMLNYYAALVNAYSVDNFSISGQGTINGNGLKFWKQFWAYRDSLKQMGQIATNLDVHRPRLIFMRDSKNINIRQVNLRNSGFWTVHLYKCQNIVIDSCSIKSPKNPVAAPSTDGIDLDVCSDVIIRNCNISVNDDAICIKGGKGPFAHTLPENGKIKNVLIENCTAEYPSPGILTFGSECVHATNIKVNNCKVINCSEVILFKMRPDTYQTYENIAVNGITGSCKTIIKMAPWKQFFNLEGSKEEPFGTIRNIEISNVNVNCNTLIEMTGNKNDKVSEVYIKDSNVSASSTGFDNKFGVKLQNVMINKSLADNK
jgi:polygalacturonase